MSSTRDPPRPPLQSRLAKHHSKSDTPQALQAVVASAKRTEDVRRLEKRRDLLEEALGNALQENKRLLDELRRKRQIEERLKDEQSLAAVLTIITEAVKDDAEGPGERSPLLNAMSHSLSGCVRLSMFELLCGCTFTISIFSARVGRRPQGAGNRSARPGSAPCAGFTERGHRVCAETKASERAWPVIVDSVDCATRKCRIWCFRCQSQFSVTSPAYFECIEAHWRIETIDRSLAESNHCGRTLCAQ
jgi:hypothetical protein